MKYYKIRHSERLSVLQTAARQLNVALRQMCYSEVYQNLCTISNFFKTRQKKTDTLQQNQAALLLHILAVHDSVFSPQTVCDLSQSRLTVIPSLSHDSTLIRSRRFIH